MMENKIYDVSSYRFLKGEEVLLDANIWLSLFPAPCDTNKPFFREYSKAFENLLNAEVNLVLDPLIMSEYLNTYCRIEYSGQFKGRYGTYKKWRRSKDFKDAANVAKENAERIIKFCSMHSLPACDLNIKEILRDFPSGKLDFNDAVFIDICQKKNFKLMTNDADFRGCGINLLTANPRLLKSR